ncbi:MAG: type II toxin-antitoxin system RelE/ParE family toxin [Alphaproteobacteria bacterium]|nr:type II toxin-antitoxin system RelE/ParE family toxin [Alphaproteobacteria bacterium]
MTGARPWRIRLSDAAATDLRDILRWTAERYGAAPARTYRTTLVSAIEGLAPGPGALGVRDRPELGPSLYTLHPARTGRRARHLILFRVHGSTIDVLRILHDAMDLPRHVPDA